ncbi:fungal-specific transcription factor domain-containing protein [Macrophomina phaseolina]|uniref:Fungal-specific transcription factor domain-containing protein n=1 Tax=Macrophomina phaseolina TaxID=35725 RepID=A0ABQ8FQQ8_9PEZI|nr:fungal-specific transcription factor domain-containing protein [Macrophomina phaseolina]
MSDESNAAQHSSFLSRACENCRLRKIRCDKSIPCSSCRTLGIACQAASRTTEHRPRVVISSQYEKQIELIQERLAAIEQSVRNLSISRPTPSTRSSPGNDRLAASSHNSPSTTVAAYEGDSSFGTQTLQAGEAADRTVARVLGSSSTFEVHSALSSLKSSLETHGSSTRVHQAYLSPSAPRPAPPELTLLPVDLVVAVVRRIKVHPPFSLVGYCWPELGQLESLCEKVYFPAASIPPGSLALMHGLLFFTMRDYVTENDSGLSNWDLSTYVDLCERNFHQCLETYESLVIPTLQNIQTLLLAATRAQEQSNLHLVWTYVAAGYSMCQTLGMHREANLKNDPPEVAELKRHAFWSLYMPDKNLSLCLGRKSMFQDDDIDVNYPTISADPKIRAWDEMVNVSIRYSTCQGEVYDRLYSVTASKASPEQRLQAVEELAQKMVDMRNELVAVDTTGAWYAEHLDSMVHAADFTAYSVLTTIYRAQTSTRTGTEISSKCFEVARLGLQSHLRCFEAFTKSTKSQQLDYVTWILLYPSFTPFVVVFTHAVATMSTEDLKLLQETVGTLDQAKHISEGAQRLYDVCKAFVDAAEVLINSRQTVTGMQQHDDGSLVFPAVTDPHVPMSMQDFSRPTWADPAQNLDASNIDMSMFLGNWLGANRPVMDMLNLDPLEQDLTI